jgi:HD-like signal output (HDOD) protein
LLSDQAVDTNEVADLISSDPTFTARLLQRVNSAEFGLVSHITNVRSAVALLGLDTTRKIILAHATAAYAQGGLRTEAMRRCWQHSVATAVIAEEIGAACNAFSSVAFTAGIIHDIGRLGLLVAYPEEYEQVIRTAAERSLDVLDFEEQEFGAHHAEAGRLLAERWGLPPEMGVIAGRHHDPCEGTELTLLRIVNVACRLADTLGYDVVQPLSASQTKDVIAELPEAARLRLSSAPEEFCQRIEQRIQEFGSKPANAPPEESLALLASASAHDDQHSGTTEAELDANSSLELTSGPFEALGMPTPPSRHRAIILWTTVGLVAVAAVVFWACIRTHQVFLLPVPF